MTFKRDSEGSSDFDFAIEDIEDYYSDGSSEDGDAAEQSLVKDDAPNVRRIRSRFTNGVRMLEIVARLIENGVLYSVKIHSDTNELSDFRKHKGSYATIYYTIKPMFGTLVTNKVEILEKAYNIVIKRYGHSSNDKNYVLLVKIAKRYEQKINHMMMIAKVSFETERMGSGPRARQKILS